MQIKCAVSAILAQHKKALSMNELRYHFKRLTRQDLYCLTDQVHCYTDDAFVRLFYWFKYQVIDGQLFIQQHSGESLIEQMVDRTRYRSKRKKDRRIQSPLNWSKQDGSRCYIGK